MQHLTFYKIKKIEERIRTNVEVVHHPTHVYFNNLTNSIWFSTKPDHVSEFDVYLGVL